MLDFTKFKLIIGLGNPGNEYSNTWHNVGFLFLDYLAKSVLKNPEIIERKDYILNTFLDPKLVLLKPLKFMNRSGEVVADYIRYSNLAPEEILIVHDDLDIQFGEYKIQYDKFSRTHNGIRSIHEKTGMTNFNYLRIGIETRDATDRVRFSGEDYVLSQIGNKNLGILKKLFAEMVSES